MRAKYVVSYVDEAKPLTFERLHYDLTQARIHFEGEGVDEFVMWEHQLDWLIKLAKAPAIRSRIDTGHYEIRDHGWSWLPNSGSTQIWGVPVEVISP